MHLVFIAKLYGFYDVENYVNGRFVTRRAVCVANITIELIMEQQNDTRCHIGHRDKFGDFVLRPDDGASGHDFEGIPFWRDTSNTRKSFRRGQVTPRKRPRNCRKALSLISCTYDHGLGHFRRRSMRAVRRILRTGKVVDKIY